MKWTLVKRRKWKVGGVDEREAAEPPRRFPRKQNFSGNASAAIAHVTRPSNRCISIITPPKTMTQSNFRWLDRQLFFSYECGDTMSADEIWEFVVCERSAPPTIKKEHGAQQESKYDVVFPAMKGRFLSL